MELALLVQSPLSCSGRGVFSERNGLKIKPFLVGSFPHVRSGQLSSVSVFLNSWTKEFPASGFSFRITATAGLFKFCSLFFLWIL
ncbi:hypothetical protein POTOM_016618 [Populus tomentosa]|uniref:Uncharacterized protein n=1 Tax=Populus tomentosa TaxID=118781 RepID=A0A8X7ZT39_POPTO|nr:hypothetical protein POTOM_016618 [Populus tomentosa]